MELQWTSKALSDLARLYEFLAPANRQAAALVVQSLTKAPTTPAALARPSKAPNWEPSGSTVLAIILKDSNNRSRALRLGNLPQELQSGRKIGRGLEAGDQGLFRRFGVVRQLPLIAGDDPLQ